VLMPPTEIPGVATLALFSDPAGNIVGLTKG
jgi:predicted enzyme related to lactoylglutathione lyase